MISWRNSIRDSVRQALPLLSVLCKRFKATVNALVGHPWNRTLQKSGAIVGQVRKVEDYGSKEFSGGASLARVGPVARTREVLASVTRDGIDPPFLGQLPLVRFDSHKRPRFFVDIVIDLSYIRVASKMSTWDDR